MRTIIPVSALSLPLELASHTQIGMPSPWPSLINRDQVRYTTGVAAQEDKEFHTVALQQLSDAVASCPSSI